MADTRASLTRPERPDGTTAVAVCVPTLRRPAGLAALLDGLARLDPPPAGVDVKVVVVDNDAAGSARPVADAARAAFPFPLTYVVEPDRGIPFARNRAVAAAGDFDFLAFLDDDEIPVPGWLNQLLATQHATGADVVTSPVLPLYDGDPPAWVVAGRFFERPRFREGAQMRWATTSTVLVARHVFPTAEPPFKESMRLSGGTDTHFFHRAWLQGHRIVWSDGAVVMETIPESRMTPAWLLRREYRRGITLSLCLRDLEDSWPRRLRRAGQGVLRITQGAGALAGSLPRGKAARLRAVQRICFGAGLLTGLVGVQYHEYRTIHGR